MSDVNLHMECGNVRKFCEWGGHAGPVADTRTDYERFIARKRQRVEEYGFEIDADAINHNAFDWQRRIAQWCIRRGRSALFLSVGLGKSLIQLEWARIVHAHTGMPGIVHCPIGVRQQFVDEAAKFGIDCPIAIVNEPEDVIDGINLVNYHKLHKFDTSRFGWVSLDESSILKSQTGSVRNELIAAWQHCRFRLSATATPAPNDHVELGNQAEFLGVANYPDMLNRYFVHDSGETQTWRLRRHAVRDFWQWVASWSVCIAMPSDIGGSDDGYILPELCVHHHRVEVEAEPQDGFLFATRGISATTIHEDRRQTNQSRCAKAAAIAKDCNDYCIIWCDTDYEADELAKLLPDAIEVRGSEKDAEKERKLTAFCRRECRVLITKPSIAGFGLNLQHCNQMIFAGVSYSFERYYQAVGRCLRFGQKRPVHAHIIMTDTDSSVNSALFRKEAAFVDMRFGMNDAMRDGMLIEFGMDRHKQRYAIQHKGMELPQWLR